MSALIRQSYANNLQPLFTPFGFGNLPSQIFEYALPSGTNGGAATQQIYQTRPINQGQPALDMNGYSTQIPGVRLNNNLITLPPGTYSVSCSAVGLMQTQKIRLYDTTNNVVIAIGLSVGAENRNNESSVMAEFSVVSPIELAVQFWGLNDFGGNAQCWGQAVGAGDDEIYLQMNITKEE
jgi:hypothetical protein